MALSLGIYRKCTKRKWNSGMICYRCLEYWIIDGMRLEEKVSQFDDYRLGEICKDVQE